MAQQKSDINLRDVEAIAPERRAAADNPDRWLWLNRNKYAYYVTFHMKDKTIQRRSFALKTSDVVEARKRRDRCLAAIRRAISDNELITTA